MEANLSYDSICVPARDIIACEVEGNIILLPLVAGVGDFDDKICTLSETGWAIWQKLNEEQTLGQVIERLAEEFSLPTDEIGKDVLGFVSEMVRCGRCILLQSERLKKQSDIGAAGKKNEGSYENRELAHIKSVEELLPSYIIHGGELRLSNPGQLKLLHCMKDRGISLRTVVCGISMHPFIRNQDVITIVPLDNHRLGVGEVVASIHPENGRLMIHRIIKRTKSGWLIKGDNCAKTDGVVAAENIIGLVTRIERNGKEVRLGLGFNGKWVAVLNRGKGLAYIKRIWHLIRLAPGYMLLKAQSISVYRKLGRLLVQQVNISVAEENDMEKIHQYFNPSTPYYKQAPAPNVTSLVAKQKGKLVGVVRLINNPNDHFPRAGYWLFSLHVKSKYRGLGIGEKLVSLCIEEAKKRGASELFLLVNEDNRRAINLNDKLGFKAVILNELEPMHEEEMHRFGLKRIVMKKALR